MPIGRIEKIVRGLVVQSAERNKRGFYVCHAFGTNVAPVELATLDDVAHYLRANPGSGVRMNPGESKVSKHVYIDGLPR
jgi:hypothetical protein